MTARYERFYEKLFPLGQGTDTEVYCVRQKYPHGTGSFPLTERTYACKTSGQIKRLEREARFLQAARHPLFPKWHDYWEAGGKGYLVMEYISGSTLEKLLKQRGSFPQKKALCIALELAAGLASLHGRTPPLLYLDLKPANILIQDTGKVRLVDFGTVCLLSGRAEAAGTPGYAAPEVLRTEAFSERTDVYSLGKVLHYMLTGKDPCLPPYEAAPIRVYDRKLWRGPEQTVCAALQEDAAARVPDMREFMRQLAVYVTGTPKQIFCRELSLHFQKPEARKALLYEKNIYKSTYFP
ncbi:MAG: serine/threonine protein kinase [Clostridium sp.]|jgi:serine/threonine-protein kinase|nr:serine/threonine protein kinase [Clostridium sp.]